MVLMCADVLLRNYLFRNTCTSRCCIVLVCVGFLSVLTVLSSHCLHFEVISLHYSRWLFFASSVSSGSFWWSSCTVIC